MFGFVMDPQYNNLYITVSSYDCDVSFNIIQINDNNLAIGKIRKKYPKHIVSFQHYTYNQLMTHFESPIRPCPGCYILQNNNSNSHIYQIDISPLSIRTLETRIPKKDKIPRTIMSPQSIAII